MCTQTHTHTDIHTYRADVTCISAAYVYVKLCTHTHSHTHTPHTHTYRTHVLKNICVYNLQPRRRAAGRTPQWTQHKRHLDVVGNKRAKLVSRGQACTGVHSHVPGRPSALNHAHNKHVPACRAEPGCHPKPCAHSVHVRSPDAGWLLRAMRGEPQKSDCQRTPRAEHQGCALCERGGPLRAQGGAHARSPGLGGGCGGAHATR